MKNKLREEQCDFEDNRSMAGVIFAVGQILEKNVNLQRHV
jgi:hypothetical protein